MKSVFRGYYPPSDHELEEMWDHGLLILDTNALLNLFRYSKGTKDDFIRVLRTRSESLWLPHHVGWEFQRRRLEVIHQQDAAFDEIQTTLKSARDAVQKTLKKFDRHPSLNSVELAGTVGRGLDEIDQLVAAAREKHATTVVDTGENERTFTEITELYQQRVGAACSEQELRNIYETGAERYDKKIPPGFSDSQKPEPDRYGDLVIWKQILQKGHETSKSAVFVTDDGKEDWWQKSFGKTLGPRVELVAEYYEAAGARIHFYAPERFLAYAKEQGTSVSQESLSEVEQVSTARNTDRAAAILTQHREQLIAERESVQRRLHGIHDGAREDVLRRRTQARLEELERRLDGTQRLRRYLDLELRGLMSEGGEAGVEAESASSESRARIERLLVERDSVDRDVAQQMRDLEQAAQELDRNEYERPRRLAHRLVARAVELDGELDEVSRALDELASGTG